MNNQEIKDVVKLIIIFCLTILIVILGTAVFTKMAAQTSPFMYSISKDGKETHKECLSVSVTDSDAIFIVTGTSYQAFKKLADKIWVDAANQKVIQRTVQANGTVVFWKTDKKAFYYSPTTKKQVQ